MEDTLKLKERLLERYDAQLYKDGVSGKRLAERLDILSEIGRTADNGSNRPGFSHEEKAAKELVMQWMEEAGMQVRMDGAGNVFGRLEGTNPDLPAVLSGSHVDTVPNGGHFDGTLGVLAALEVAEAWKATGYQPEKPYEVVVFTDEEGSRFQEGLSGSEAMMGQVDLEAKKTRRDANGMWFEEVLEDVGLSVDSYVSAKRDVKEIDSFVEVHIEQGKRLE
ncbi:hydantoinase/carbamoylase family amidase, partial [Atopococcus tabaci]|uniref:hydantoinase/carbamoylase family amidase n=1 Tax=Atopococcus tabaci TaxID=269774 RepID=UPI002409F8AA